MEKSIKSDLCSYAIYGKCRFGDKCRKVHGEKCEFCGLFCLHPLDEEQRKNHVKECIKEHEKAMEFSFCVAETNALTCAICMEAVMEKEIPGDRRFGILPNCNHCFCISCIRKWRKNKDLDDKVTRGCPVCRLPSNFICASRTWFNSKEEKMKLIQNYKDALSHIPCRYYSYGSGKCPFGNQCFYMHSLPDGTRIDGGPPPSQNYWDEEDGSYVNTEIGQWNPIEEQLRFPEDSVNDSSSLSAQCGRSPEEISHSDGDF